MKISLCPQRAFRRRRKALFVSILLWLGCLAAQGGEGIVRPVGEQLLRVEIGYRMATRALTPDRMSVTLPLPLGEHYQGVEWTEDPPGLTFRYRETDDEYLYVRFTRDYLARERNYDAGYGFFAAVSGKETDFSRISESYPYNRNDAQYRRYTGYNGEFIAPKHGRVGSLARRIGSGDAAVDYARKAYSHIVKNFALKRENGLKPLESVFTDGGGNGVNLCSLLVSLLRHKDIPARHVAGFGIGGGERIYVEFLLEGYGWIPVDLVTAMEEGGADYFGRVSARDPVIVMSRDIDLTVKTVDGEEKVAVMTKGLCRWAQYVDSLRGGDAAGAKVRTVFVFDAAPQN